MIGPAAIVRRRRPPRGTPAVARERLVAAAALELERAGYFATDTNRIARAAGFAPAYFYKHFEDKLDVFFAVYDTWVANEWQELETLAAKPGEPRARLSRIVDFLVEHHRRWRNVRAALKALVAMEPRARRRHATARAAQLARWKALRPDGFDRARAGLAMLYVERLCDAIAFDELAALGVSEAQAKAAMVATLA